jgi:hypothetical protein
VYCPCNQNAFFKRWDGMVMLALLFTASVTPFEVAFLTPGINTLFFLNRLVDLLFLVVLASLHIDTSAFRYRIPPLTHCCQCVTCDDDRALSWADAAFAGLDPHWVLLL